MNHIQKVQWMGCAAATAAMFGDLDYAEVSEHRPNLDPARTRWPNELCALLQAVTGSRWRYQTCWFPRKRVAKFAFPRSRWPIAAFIIDSEFCTRAGQWIVVKDGIVHDPGLPRCYTVGSYPLRDWRVLWIAAPVRPEELPRAREAKRLERFRSLLEAETGLECGIR
jgi:hypothetical protein